MRGEQHNNQGKGTVGLCSILAIVFIVLKLCGVISWSWVWVLAPIWIPVAFVVAFIAFCFFMAAITGQLTATRRRPR